jgi:hypothetical protein
MFRLALVLVLVFGCAFASSAHACTPPPSKAHVRVSFLADSDLTALVKWAKRTTCVTYTFEPALAERRLAQGVILKVVGRDIGSIFEILLHTMNLKVEGRGSKRSIVADGPEPAESQEANERERASIERTRLLANLDGEITRKAGGHYTITRKGADAAFTSLSRIARTIRVVPETKSGKPIGYRIVAMKSDAPLAHVGFQVGDIVVSLNGTKLTSSQKALAAYAKARIAGIMRADGIRAQKPFSIELKVE